MLFLFIADGVPVRDKEDVVVYAVGIQDNILNSVIVWVVHEPVHDGRIQCHFCSFRLLVSEQRLVY